MESNILKKNIKILIYIIIVLLSIILLYSKFHTRQMDIELRDFLNQFHKVTGEPTRETVEIPATGDLK